MNKTDDFDSFANPLPTIAPPVAPDYSHLFPKGRAAWICQDCGEPAPTGLGMCRRCAEIAE